MGTCQHPARGWTAHGGVLTYVFDEHLIVLLLEGAVRHVRFIGVNQLGYVGFSAFEEHDNTPTSKDVVGKGLEHIYCDVANAASKCNLAQ